jgi:hypothetical protein
MTNRGRGYVIQWKSKTNGRIGIGKKEFSRGEAEHLAEELNQEYPEIHHEAVKAKVVAARRVEAPEEHLVAVE